jgi:hypothetical protein
VGLSPAAPIVVGVRVTVMPGTTKGTPMNSRLPDRSELPPPAWPPEISTATPAATRPSRTRRYTVIGLTAGLLGGSAIGLAATLPTASQAADDPVLEAVSEPEQPALGEPGEWVRDALAALVDDGTLTAEQLDAVVAALDAARPDRPLRPHGPWLGGRGEHLDRGHLFGDREELAALFGIDVDTLASELQSGKSLATLAEEHGVDVDAVIDLLVADAEARMADRAETIRERVTELVTRDG